MKSLNYALLLLLICTSVYGQSEEKKEPEAPRILTTRGEENYASLKENDSIDFFLKNLKYIPLNQNGNAYLTLGGQYRARMDLTRNGNFRPEDETSYLQRINVHAAFNFSPRFRLFTEFYHGWSSAGEVTLQSDNLALHQGFIDWQLAGKGGRSLNLRLGRQELGCGASRLVGIRNGPNLRRSFDMAQVRMRYQQNKIDVFYGSEVRIAASSFDNRSSIFDWDGPNPRLWGVYVNRSIAQNLRFVELYYLGFHSSFSSFNDVTGEETRHSFGLRSYGSWGRFTYNTELIFQVGSLADNDVFAYNFEADWKYRLSDTGWKPQIGLKLDWSSGDQEMGDGKIGTFNPYFVNPGIYSLASVNTPANMTSLHPNISIQLTERLFIYLDYAFFYRTQTADGFYSPPRFQSRLGATSDTKHLGDTFGLMIKYEINRNLSFDLVTYHFRAGTFIEETGESENTSFIAPTLSFRF